MVNSDGGYEEERIVIPEITGTWELVSNSAGSTLFHDGMKENVGAGAAYLIKMMVARLYTLKNTVVALNIAVKMREEGEK